MLLSDLMTYKVCGRGGTRMSEQLRIHFQESRAVEHVEYAAVRTALNKKPKHSGRGAGVLVKSQHENYNLMLSSLPADGVRREHGLRSCS